MAIHTSPVANSRLVFPALMGALLLALLSRLDSPAGRGFFLMHLGLFMLWQPFVQGNRRLSLSSLLGILLILAIVFFGAGGLLFVAWIMSLTAIVAGRAALVDDRLSRKTYQLAFVALLLELLFVAVPGALPVATVQPELASIVNYVLVLLVLAILFLQSKEKHQAIQKVSVDFFSGIVVFLTLATLILGSLSAMLVLHSNYIEALLQSMLLMGGGLLLMGWTWNPHGGVAGLGDLFSRYLLSVGLPVERWLDALANDALEVDDPEHFLAEGVSSMVQSLRWIRGVEWETAARNGHVGFRGGYCSEYKFGGLRLKIFTNHRLTASLRFHLGLLVRILAEFYADKRRARDLRNLSYVQAVHETGARLTHDIKNILQSLNALCIAAREDETGTSSGYQRLLKKQLPVIADRLGTTLLKLQSPTNVSQGVEQPADIWWSELLSRLAPHDWISFSPITVGGRIPGDVFSGVIDNLVQNVIEKRQREPEVQMWIGLVERDRGIGLEICDNGSALPDPIADTLFSMPVSSKTGFGVGLYQAARHAEVAGYRLSLAENQQGRVCFSLVPHSRMMND